MATLVLIFPSWFGWHPFNSKFSPAPPTTHPHAHRKRLRERRTSMQKPAPRCGPLRQQRRDSFRLRQDGVELPYAFGIAYRMLALEHDFEGVGLGSGAEGVIRFECLVEREVMRRKRRRIEAPFGDQLQKPRGRERVHETGCDRDVLDPQ